MMLRPTSVSENSSRGNTAYGESSGYYDPNSVSNGTLNLHGDVARLMLQHMMRWGNTSKMFGSSGVMESRAVLLKWMEEDPVDTWEMGRNDAVQAITGVRNVFVDYPELGFLLLGAEVPSGYSTPSGAAAKTATVSGSTVEVAERSATRATKTANYSGAAFIDGIGSTSSVEEMNKYGPKNEVYLANGQAIVFYLVGDKAVENLQIGAKAANGTAHIKITALNSPDTVVLDKELVTATEMYYEFGSGISWASGVSSAIVIENTGSGVLSITNLRYLTADGSLAFYVNSNMVTRSRLLLATGSSVPETEPELPEDVVTPSDIITPSDVPTESTEPEVSTEPEASTEPETPTESENPTDPEPIETEIKVEQFTDISEDDWFYDGVKYAVESGLMNGVSEDEFAPDDTLTRAMLVTILYRLAGAPAVDENAKIIFTDVEDDQWYTDAIIWASMEGITNGVTETTFGTNDPVTREQMVTFLWRYVGEPESTQSLADYPDADKISAFAEVAMRWAVENQIITGNAINGKAYIDPQGNATRAQIAIIFMRSEKTLALSE
ncbi:MAG: S-layer homology domain-containing protein, partial [Faecousia sp.]